MPKVVLKDCYVTIDGVNFSDHISQVELSAKKSGIETTNFSGGGTEKIAGLKDDEITITFQQDFAAASVDATLYPLYHNEVEFIIEVRPRPTAVSATNPKYTATSILLEYQPLSGKVGELSEIKTKFPCQRTGITRAIA